MCIVTVVIYSSYNKVSFRILVKGVKMRVDASCYCRLLSSFKKPNAWLVFLLSVLNACLHICMYILAVSYVAITKWFGSVYVPFIRSY